jgi:Holliday junction resolvasome RuvABC ATP-dependent DNA helicase subunit
MESSKVKFNFRIIDQEKMQEDDLFSYKLDYEIMSGNLVGAKNRGTIYLRGTKGKVYDNYVFSMEKQNDFCDLEVDTILAVYEEAFKPKKGVTSQYNNKNNSIKGYFQGGGVGDNNQSTSGKEGDPLAVLHKYGVSVFMPGDKSKSELDWDYLAGYENVKRHIEDTILLGLTHGEIYDQITAGTRMKHETNRPKAVLFDGPPGCGKTTSAKIIANQVNIPLIYMPIESIMSKYYGESETRFAEIFEAAKSMGKCIIFIDEIDALASSREGGIHEASRRILSTLLRKIDGFESDGEVLLICATNRSKDLDPALLSRLDLSIKFDLPDERMRSLIFQRYAKHLSQADLEELGKLSLDLSGRDIADICKDAERRWAAMYIRKEKKELLPDKDIYKECLKQRIYQMKGVNRQFENSSKAYWQKH